MRKLLALLGFFFGTSLFLTISIFLLLYLSFEKRSGKTLGDNQAIAYAEQPKPTESPQLTPEPDPRIETLKLYFSNHNSILGPYAPDIVAAADRYNIDFRLLPAIAMQESNLCRRMIIDSYNCWGYGIHGSKVTTFNNFPEAIEIITKTLATKYREKGLVTPAEIAMLYNPTNTNNWTENVTYFMDLLK